MNRDRDNRAEAAGILQIAVKRMLKRYPFHARFLAAGQFVPSADVTTMAITVRGGRLVYMYSPDFVSMCTYDALTGLLHHEVNHILFGHLLDDPSDFQDERALIIAQEVTANEFVREPLPGEPITLAQFPSLPPGEDTVTRYSRLASPDGKSPRSGPKTGSQGRKTGPAGPKTRAMDAKIGTKKVQNSPAGSQKSAGLQLIDDHRFWEEARAQPILSKLAICVAVRQAREQLNDEQWAALPDAIRQQVVNIGASSGAGSEMAALSGGHATTFDWRRALRRFIGGALDVRPVFNRPARRFPQLVGLVPGQGRRPEKPRVMAVIDTSASLTTAMLTEIGRELDRLGRSTEVVVVECDAVIQRVYPYRATIHHVRGRGGTDLRPAFEPSFLRKLQPDVVVYFTDGEGLAPEMKPAVPVLWGLTPDGRKPAPWGRVVRLSNSA